MLNLFLLWVLIFLTWGWSLVPSHRPKGILLLRLVLLLLLLLFFLLFLFLLFFLGLLGLRLRFLLLYKANDFAERSQLCNLLLAKEGDELLLGLEDRRLRDGWDEEDRFLFRLGFGLILLFFRLFLLLRGLFGFIFLLYLLFLICCGVFFDFVAGHWVR